MTILFIALGIIFIVTGMILFSSATTERKRLPEMTISLEELAQIWLPYNETVKNVPTSDEDIEKLFGDLEETTSKTEDSEQASSEKTETADATDKTQKQQDEISIIESIGPLKEFWAYCIQPYKQEIQEQGVSPVIQELINLIEKHGQNPSIVIDNRDSEAVELVSVRDNLAQVTLKEHTYHCYLSH
ncbi:TPA: hypothetical protein ENS27_18410 [bacterium]|nr:hypothetical protein [bacterium]